MSQFVLEIKNLKKYFPVSGGLLGRKVEDIKAVDDVSFRINKGETLGLVGESGCGKTTLGRCLLMLLKPTAGDILFNVYMTKDDSDIEQMEQFNLTTTRELKKIRKEMQIVHQDPFDSLDPRMLIKNIIAEPLTTHKVSKGQPLLNRVRELLEQVGMGEGHLYRYPHELSGGQLQRICIARALALNPEFIVLDEPTSALDVSVQAQILNLLKRLQSELGLTYLFISHDISVIDHMSDRIAVMYLGKIVEIAEKDALMGEPLHPYTRALLSSIPTTNPRDRMLDRVIFIEGDVPSPMNPPLGCRFHTRCPAAFEHCGWEARDFIIYMQSNPGKLEMENATLTADGFRLHISFEPGLAQKKKLQETREAVEELIEREKMDNPLFKSIEKVEIGEDRITLHFLEANEPTLDKVKDEHEVACLLYKDE